MDFRDTADEAAFREEVRAWLAEHFVGEFLELAGRGDPSDEDNYDLRVEWERVLGADRWVGMSWPVEYGGRALEFSQQVIFNVFHGALGQLFDRFGWAACVGGIGVSLGVAAVLALRLRLPAEAAA